MGVKRVRSRLVYWRAARLPEDALFLSAEALQSHSKWSGRRASNPRPLPWQGTGQFELSFCRFMLKFDGSADPSNEKGRGQCFLQTIVYLNYAHNHSLSRQSYQFVTSLLPECNVNWLRFPTVKCRCAARLAPARGAVLSRRFGLLCVVYGVRQNS